MPRSWTHLLAEAAGHPIDPSTPTPQVWQTEVIHRTGARGPMTMTDDEPATFRDFASGHDPADPVDRAIVATMRAVFPSHGLDMSDVR